MADYLSDPKTRKREIEGLLSAMDSFGLKKGFIITSDTEEHLRKENKQITIIPFWRWSLEAT